MLIDIRVPVGRPILQTADFVARCEDAGFDGVGVHDHPHSGRDVYVTLAIAAERTRIARLYPATSSPIVRHPLLLASAAQSLEEIAPGRICLTIAPGFLDRGRRGGLDGSTIYVTLRADFVLDCHGRAVDGDHIGGRLPSGNGREGGEFHSWFRVDDDRSYYRTAGTEAGS